MTQTEAEAPVHPGGEPANRPARLADIANIAQTSITTVSRVINGDARGSVSAAKRKEILRIAEKLAYRPNRRARLFVQQRTDCLGVILPAKLFTGFSQRATAPLLLEHLCGATEYLSSINYTTMLLVAPEEDPVPFLEKEFLGEERVEGVIFFGREESAPVIAKLHAAGLPVAGCSRNQAAHAPLSYVDFEIKNALREAAARLHALGHREAGVVYAARSKMVAERANLWRGIWSERGVGIPDSRFANAESETDAYLVTQRMIGDGNLPTVLFYTSDHFAMLGIEAILDAGLRVPEDVSVLGYDGARYAKESRVPLSTIALDRKEAGKLAAQIIVDIREGRKEGPMGMLLPAKFVEKKSIGPAPGEPRRADG